MAIFAKYALLQGMSNTKVKAGSIQTLAAARYFSSKMVEMVGFCFDSSKAEFIAPRDAQQVKGWLQGPKIVGEFNGNSLKEIKETAMILGLDYVQIAASGKEALFDSLNLNVILEVQVDMNDSFDSLQNRVSPWLGKVSYIQWGLNAHFGNWENFILKSKLGTGGLRKLCAWLPAIVDVHVTESGLWQIITEVEPEMINLTTEPESKAGEKSFENLDPLFTILEDEF